MVPARRQRLEMGCHVCSCTAVRPSSTTSSGSSSACPRRSASDATVGSRAIVKPARGSATRELSAAAAPSTSPSSGARAARSAQTASALSIMATTTRNLSLSAVHTNASTGSPSASKPQAVRRSRPPLTPSRRVESALFVAETRLLDASSAFARIFAQYMRASFTALRDESGTFWSPMATMAASTEATHDATVRTSSARCVAATASSDSSNT
mmetsp:Transcript_21050/g.54265  ORF Transcript_21050/g.54265 Transcript_21050/m.54265 type:complete len:212 (+) Transcript_21050:426-1061(+)